MHSETAIMSAYSVIKGLQFEIIMIILRSKRYLFMGTEIFM